MEHQEEFLALLKESLENVREPRFFETERGFQGELLAHLRNRLEFAGFPGGPIVEQEYQKTLPHHGLNIRPDIIIHIPFERGHAEWRDAGNFVAMELKLRSTEHEAREDFAKLQLMRDVLGYPLTIFINVNSDQTHSAVLPEAIAGQTVCYAVRLENGNSMVRVALPEAGNDGGH